MNHTPVPYYSSAHILQESLKDMMVRLSAGTQVENGNLYFILHKSEQPPIFVASVSTELPGRGRLAGPPADYSGPTSFATLSNWPFAGNITTSLEDSWPAMNC